eukprot:TRINITY_DN13285_c0_g2_i2.p1 TRINITY_DN13285_c0_g2~~TRINITY_DN13285_c0_g2_i2.p1  ORF type:complete len:314 (-),score=23.51 TRINITY_DN13285_c0_g2_i2:228-1169(-)
MCIRDRTYTEHGKDIITICAVGDDKRFVSSDWSPAIKFWDPTIPQSVVTVPQLQQKLYMYCYSTLSPTTAALGSNNGAVIILDTTNYTIIRELVKPHSRHIVAVTGITDTDFLAAAGRDSLIRIWNWKTGEVVKKLNTGAAFTYWIQSLQDNRFLAMKGKNGAMEVWNWEREVKLGVSAKFYVDVMITNYLIPKGCTFVLFAVRQMFYIWDWAKKRTIRNVSIRKQDALLNIQFTSQSEEMVLAGGRGEEVYEFRWKTGEVMRTFTNTSVAASNLCFLSDGQYLVAQSKNNLHSIEVYRKKTEAIIENKNQSN